MKKVFILVLTLLSSLAMNAQNFYVELWGSKSYKIKKKDLNDSLLYLTKGQDSLSYDLYQGGRKIDELYCNKEFRKRRVLLKFKGNKYYIKGYEVLMDSTMMKEMESYGMENPTHSSHYSSNHVSHSSHYSQVVNGTHSSHVSHSSHYSHFSSSF